MDEFDIALEHDYSKYKIIIETPNIYKTYTHFSKDSTKLIPMIFDRLFLHKRLNIKNNNNITFNFPSMDVISLIIKTTINHQKHIVKHIYFDQKHIKIKFFDTMTIIHIININDVGHKYILNNVFGIRVNHTNEINELFVEPANNVYGYRVKTTISLDTECIFDNICKYCYYTDNRLPMKVNNMRIGNIHEIRDHLLPGKYFKKDLTELTLYSLINTDQCHQIMEVIHKSPHINKLNIECTLSPTTQWTSNIFDITKDKTHLRTICIQNISNQLILPIILYYMHKNKTINDIEIIGSILYSNPLNLYHDCFEKIREEYGNHKILGLCLSHIKKYNETLYEKSLLPME